MEKLLVIDSSEMQDIDGGGLISGAAGALLGAMVAPVAAAITHWSGGDEQDTKAAALATFTACVAIGAASPLP